MRRCRSDKISKGRNVKHLRRVKMIRIQTCSPGGRSPCSTSGAALELHVLRSEQKGSMLLSLCRAAAAPIRLLGAAPAKPLTQVEDAHVRPTGLGTGVRIWPKCWPLAPPSSPGQLPSPYPNPVSLRPPQPPCPG